MKTSRGIFCLFIYYVILSRTEHGDCDRFLSQANSTETRTANARRKGSHEKQITQDLAVTKIIAVTTNVTVTTIVAVTRKGLKMLCVHLDKNCEAGHRIQL